MELNRKPVCKAVWLPRELDQRLADIKRRLGITKSHIIREGIALALAKYDRLMARPEGER
jgi:predicted DNA-binding protein